MTVFKSSKKLKAEARASLLGKLGVPVLSVSLYFLITSVLAELIAFSGTDSRLLALLLSVVVFFVVNVFSKMLRIGLSCIFLKLHLGERAVIGDLLSAFRGSSDTAVKLSVILTLPELLSMLPVLIAVSLITAWDRPVYTVLAIVLFLAGAAGSAFFRIVFALCPYLLLDFPSLSARALVRGGARMIRGHKIRLFRLYLSFLPQYVLTLLSLGIAGLWVMSYTEAAAAAFYRDLAAALGRR